MSNLYIERNAYPSYPRRLPM